MELRMMMVTIVGIATGIMILSRYLKSVVPSTLAA